MSEPNDTREEEWTLPVDGEFEVIDGGLRKSVVPLEIHKAALVANREKDAKIERLKGILAGQDGAMEENVRLRSQLASLRASVGGEKWIEIKEGCKMPTHDQKVLTYSDDMGCRIIPFGTSVKGMPPHVTHWQPLPAPPTLHTDKE